MLTSKGSASDLVLFVERANELWYVARLRSLSFEAVGKPSLNRAFSYVLYTRNRVTYPCAG